jgi:hypothetical protein
MNLFSAQNECDSEVGEGKRNLANRNGILKGVRPPDRWSTPTTKEVVTGLREIAAGKVALVEREGE